MKRLMILAAVLLLTATTAGCGCCPRLFRGPSAAPCQQPCAAPCQQPCMVPCQQPCVVPCQPACAVPCQPYEPCAGSVGGCPCVEPCAPTRAG